MTFEVLEKIGLAIIGGVIVWIGTLIADRRKKKDEQRQQLRTAYSKWFAAEAILVQRTKSLESWIGKTPSNKEQHDGIIREVKLVEDEMKPLLVSLNEILLLETNSTIRRLIIELNTLLESTFALIQNVSLHHSDHMEKREKREIMRQNLKLERDKEKKQMIQKEIDDITAWDEKCKLITPEGAKRLCELMGNIHEAVYIVRDIVTSVFVFNLPNEILEKSLESKEN